MKKTIAAGLLALTAACVTQPEGNPDPGARLPARPAHATSPAITSTCKLNPEAKSGFMAEVTNNSGQTLSLSQPTIIFLHSSGRQLASHMIEQGPGEQDTIAPGATADYGQIVAGTPCCRLPLSWDRVLASHGTRAESSSGGVNGF